VSVVFRLEFHMFSFANSNLCVEENKGLLVGSESATIEVMEFDSVRSRQAVFEQLFFV
jgi:hypothetical protein